MRRNIKTLGICAFFMAGILAVSVMAGNQTKKKKTGPSSETVSAVYSEATSEILSEASSESAASTALKEKGNSDNNLQVDGNLKNGRQRI